jgi:hypothetical protein
MSGPLDFARTASIVGDPACAAMLEALMDGRALIATDCLARHKPRAAILRK